MPSHLGRRYEVWEDVMMSGRMPPCVEGCCDVWEDVVMSEKVPSHLEGCHDIWEEDAMMSMCELLKN